MLLFAHRQELSAEPRNLDYQQKLRAADPDNMLEVKELSFTPALGIVEDGEELSETPISAPREDSPDSAGGGADTRGSVALALSTLAGPSSVVETFPSVSIAPVVASSEDPTSPVVASSEDPTSPVVASSEGIRLHQLWHHRRIRLPSCGIIGGSDFTAVASSEVSDLTAVASSGFESELVVPLKNRQWNQKQNLLRHLQRR